MMMDALGGERVLRKPLNGPRRPFPVLPGPPLVGALRPGPASSVVSKPGTSSLFLIFRALPRPRQDRHVKKEDVIRAAGLKKSPV